MMTYKVVAYMKYCLFRCHIAQKYKRCLLPFYFAPWIKKLNNCYIFAISLVYADQF